MPAVAKPLAGGGSPAPPPDNLVGHRRPPSASSSPNPKGDREAQQSKKRAKQTAERIHVESDSDAVLEDAPEMKDKRNDSGSPPASAWTSGTGAARRLFSEFFNPDEWYVADSDSEDVAAAIREDGLEDGMEVNDDPLCPNIHFEAAEERQFCRKLRSALVVKVLGRYSSYTIVSRRLNTLWAKAGGIQVASAKNGYFIVRFTSGIDYERAITGGPWMVGDNYLTVHTWNKHFNPYSHEISSTLVWARLLDIPAQYFNTEAVTKIGKWIGKPLRVDQATSRGARLDYARICVEVDLSKPLLSQFKIHGIKYFIQYEGLEKICLNCGKYFERSGCYCSTTTASQPAEEPMPKTPCKETDQDPDKIYGEWMITKRRPRTTRQGPSSVTKPAGTKATNADKVRGSGSRFTALVDENCM
ncbi:unnamed protein product [Linum trigynum]|uniref:DUF4283 domain-containing protein n=1 Tax=Linum trigynum TaxID=586398 RepID=A0AAV2DXV4_9ROSI